MALGALPPEVTAGSPSSVQIRITDDDPGDDTRDPPPPPPGGGGGGGGAPRDPVDDAPANRAPKTAEEIEAATLAAGAALEIDLSDAFDDPDGDALEYTAESSDESVATVEVDGDTLTVRGLGRGAAEITVTATDAGRGLGHADVRGDRDGAGGGVVPAAGLRSCAAGLRARAEPLGRRGRGDASPRPTTRARPTSR